MTDWVRALCDVSTRWRGSELSIRQLFTAAAPPPMDRAAFLAAVTPWLRAHPDVVEAWGHYCQDRRGSPAPVWSHAERWVGFYGVEAGTTDVVTYDDVVEACADYVHREVSWVLRDRPSQ